MVLEVLVSRSCVFFVFCTLFFNAKASHSNELLVSMEAGKCDPGISTQLYERALRGGVLDQLAFAQATYRNLCGVVEETKQDTFVWYRKSAEQGNAVAQVALARHIFTDMPRKYWSEAFDWYQRAADQGNADAKFGLAQMYGRRYNPTSDIRKNDELALNLYREAAAEGHERSILLLALIHQKGSHGVKKDDATAAYWFHKLADIGNSFAQLQLGRIYLEGSGVAQNPKAARGWYEKSAGQGDRYAQFKLAIMLRDGVGGRRDGKKAVRLLQMAAEADESNAQFELGKIYLYGLNGVRKDLEKAEYWLNRSAKRWHPLAKQELERLDGQSTQ